MADWSYTITHYYDGGNQYLTDDVISLPLFTDTGSGEVNEATIVLNAVDGQFIKASVNSKTKIDVITIIALLIGFGYKSRINQKITFSNSLIVKPYKNSEFIRLETLYNKLNADRVIQTNKTNQNEPQMTLLNKIILDDFIRELMDYEELILILKDNQYKLGQC